MRYGVALQGWTHPSFVNPSELSTSLPALQQLLDAIKSGKCQFVKLTAEQRKAEDDEYRKKIESGQITVQARATRKDKGKKRKAREATEGGENDGSDDTGNGDEDRDGEGQAEGPPKKRRLSRRAPRRKTSKKSVEHVQSDADD